MTFGGFGVQSLDKYSAGWQNLQVKPMDLFAFLYPVRQWEKCSKLQTASLNSPLLRESNSNASWMCSFLALFQARYDSRDPDVSHKDGACSEGLFCHSMPRLLLDSINSSHRETHMDDWGGHPISWNHRHSSRDYVQLSATCWQKKISGPANSGQAKCPWRLTKPKTYFCEV